MTQHGLLTWETAMNQSDRRPRISGFDLNRDNGFSTLGTTGARYPRNLYELVGLKFEEPAVMWMAFSVVVCLKEERCINGWFHPHGPRCGKPAIELFCPSQENGMRRSSHVALDNALRWPGRKVWLRNCHVSILWVAAI
jgi:hypothetical protein